MELFQKPMVEALISSMRENAAKLKANLGGPERSHEATSKQPPPSSPAGQFLQRGTAFSPALRGMPGGSSKLVPGLCACGLPNPECGRCGMGFRQRLGPAALVAQSNPPFPNLPTRKPSRPGQGKKERERERECKIPLYNLDSESNLDMRSILNPLNHTQSTLCATRQLSSLA